ncbi:MAG: hypothetical protein HFP81_02700 [Methylococcales symbiont of Hymedesmia sp. n. MRB-2018]|nr:MAG: hypothetical protein HFP81_02700 [Methylococcales symbiont of Hymedesmia sp. n. MRB-2018]
MNEKNILYVGLGGAGKNVVKMALPDKLNEENLLLINTDKKALKDEKNIPTLLIGEKVLNGQAAGGISFGIKAVDESIYEIISAFQQFEEIIIVCGVAGGTGGAVIHLVKKLLNLNFSIGIFLLYPHDFENERITIAKDLILQAESIQSKLVHFQVLKPSTYADKCKELTPLSNYFDCINKLMIESIINPVFYDEKSPNKKIQRTV